MDDAKVVKVIKNVVLRNELFFCWPQPVLELKLWKSNWHLLNYAYFAVQNLVFVRQNSSKNSTLEDFEVKLRI